MTSDRARAARNDRGSIVDTALELLDSLGLADVTMRRLAGALGVQPSALYWHFENKQTLLAALADRIVGEAASVAATGGDEEVIAVAGSLRTALLARRDGAEVVLSTYALALGSDEALHRLTAALERAHGRDAAPRAAAILLQFVLGHASLVQQRIQAARFGAYPSDEAAVVSDTAAEFDEGLRLIMRGLAA